MPNIQVVKENSLGVNRGIYADWMGTALSDASANALIAEGAAVSVSYKNPYIDQAMTPPQSSRTDISGVVAITADEYGEVTPSGLIIALFRTKYLHQFDGVDPTGQTDCADAINAALNWAQENRYSVICRDTDRFLIGSQVIIEVPLDFKMGLARFVTSSSFNAVASPTHALRVRGAFPYNQGNSSLQIRVQGPYGADNISIPPSGASTNLDGVIFGLNDSVSGQINVLNVDLWVSGFRRNITIGTHNVWSIRFRNPWSRKFLSAGMYFDCKVLSGESIYLDNPLFDNAYNAAGTATCIVSPSNSDDGTSTNQALDVIISGGSFDYTDKVYNIGSGTFSFYGPFFENNGAGEYGNQTYTAARSRPIVNIFGGVIKKGLLSATPYTGTCPANGRPAFFKTDGAVMLNIIGTQMPARESSTGTNTTGTEMVNVTGSPLQLSVSVPYDDAWSDPVAFPSNYLTQLTNGTFTSNANGWGSLPGTVTWSSADGRAATGCVEFATSASEALIKQRLPVKAGNTVFFQSWIKAVSIATGSANMILKYYGADGTTQVGTDQTLITVSATDNNWKQRGKVNRPPSGAAYVDFILQTSASFSGTVRYDDVYAVVME